MIEISNLKISYGEKIILDKINLSLPRKGFVCVCGESGIGKSSLLNAISGLIPFEGSIKIDGIEMSSLTEEQSSDFRLKNIGFVFQDFKLFVNQSVEDNITFPLAVLTNCSKKQKNHKCNALLNAIGLKGYNKRICNTLSGGEKQRVAISRAIINKPKIVLADEPTGSLDEKNGEEIMAILKSYSSKGLVIVVTHDIDLAEKYADTIVYLKNKEISKIKNYNNKVDQSVSILRKSDTKSKNTLSFNFALDHARHSLRTKRVRSVLSTLFMSIGLVGIGLSISFSNSIASDIKRAYGSLVETASVSIAKTDNTNKLINLKYQDALNLCNQYKNEMDLICGIGYKNNFEEFFKDTNSIYLESNNKICFLDEISARHFNDFSLLSDLESNVLPNNIYQLEDDEIVLGLTINQIRLACYNFGIDRTTISLSNYIKSNVINVVLDLANLDWQYTDQQIFTLRGIVLAKEPFIAHSNILFNELVFETNMRFPSTETHEINEYPWVLNKITYIRTNDHYKFITMLRHEGLLNDYLFEICDKKLFVNKYLEKRPEEIDCLIPYYCPIDRISEKEISFIESVDDKLTNPVLYNQRGYVNYPESLISGFASRTYLSFSNNALFETIENNSNVEFKNNEKEVLTHGVLFTDFTENFNDPIRFSPNIKKLIFGREPKDLNEIVISKGLLKRLEGDIDKNNKLYFASTVKEINKDIGVYCRDYETVSLDVVGITDDEKSILFHDNYWTEDFFNLKIGLSVRETMPTSLSYAIDEKTDSDLIVKKLERAFPQYEILNPLNDINNSIESLCNSISIFVLCISSVSLIISLILLCSCTYLHIQDIKKEVSLARCIGLKSKEAKKFLYGFTIYSSLIALCISSIELSITNFAVSFISAEMLSLPFKFSISYLAYIAMMVGGAIICAVSSVVSSKNISKIKPIDCLKM